MSKKIVIIGSGFGGMSAAALLAKDGHDVTVLEKNEQAGGRARVLRDKGFTFDMGPSWYMMPEVFDRFFTEMGYQTSELLDLKRLNPEYRVSWSDGEVLDIPAEPNKVAKLFDKLEPGAGKKFFQYLEDSQLKYEIAINHILYNNADNFLDYMSRPMIQHGGKLKPFQSAHSFVSSFFKNPRIQQILEYNLVFLGCSPENAPSLFTMMAHVDFNLGIWYPQGGIGKVVEAMVQVGTEAGVKYRYNTPVDKILVDSVGTTTGVIAGDKQIRADFVISNADLYHTESLLSNKSMRQYSESYWQKRTMVPSAHLMYLGIKGKIPEFLHHTLYFADDWRGHFVDVFDQPRWPVAPSLYINSPSNSDSSLAPKGHQSLMVLVPVSVGLDDNPEWRQRYGDYILDYIETGMGVDLKSQIVYRKDFSVQDFESDYNSFRGNALGGLAHTLFQSALWRPNNIHAKISNLLFSGANTVPGIGVPTSIISGHLVRDRIRDRV